MTTFETVAASVSEFQIKVASLEGSVKLLQDKIDDLENRSRRNNLIIYGLNENERETPQELHNAVIGDLFSNKLGVSVSSSERIHRLGKKTSNRTRPVIVKFFNYNDKLAVQRNCRRLKGSSLSVSEDFSERIRVIRKKLWDSSADDRARGDKVTLVYDKIRIGNTLYTWDELSSTRRALPSQNRLEQE